MTDKRGSTAYSILISNPAKIYTNIVADRDKFLAIVSEVFNHPNSENVPRLAGITFCVLYYDITLPMPYIPLFLDYIFFPDVLSLLSSIFIYQDTFSNDDYSEIGRATQNQILQTEFLTKFVEKMQRLNEAETLNTRSLINCNYFKLVSFLAQSEMFGPYVKQPDVALKLIPELKVSPVPVQNAKWEAVLSLLDENINLPAFVSIMDSAIMQLQIDDYLIHPFQCSIIQFFQRYASLYPEIRSHLVNSDIATYLVSIMSNFPNHSIMLDTVTSFLVSLTFTEEMKDHLKFTLPYIAQFVSEPLSVTLSSFCIEILKYFFDLAENNEMISQYLFSEIPMQHPAWEVLKMKMEAVKGEYGGELE